MEQHDKCAITLVYIFRTPALKANDGRTLEWSYELVFEVFFQIH